MTYVLRKIQHKIEKILNRKKSILLLGPRQTGKTTLIRQLPIDRYISLANLQIQILITCKGNSIDIESILYHRKATVYKHKNKINKAINKKH